MLGFFKKRKLAWVLTAGILLFVFFAYRGSQGDRANLLERGVYRVTAPILGLGQAVTAKLQGLYRHYFALVGVARENERLKSELQELQSKYLNLKELSLTHLVGPPHRELPSVDAKVIAQDPKSHFRSLTINRGHAQGVKVGDVVLAQGGLVGRVVRTGENQARVVLINDPRSAVAVLDQESRARGTLVGKLHKLGLNRDHWMTQGEYFSVKEEIRPGDLLLTSGLDGLFPKGLPVGWVRRVKKGPQGMFYRAEVEPYVSLQKLETVQVVL
ncbi:MAG: rod shape-determining protein MreC [bacterium]|nr:rod shape-determining protein MreC [bacterium]